MTPLGSFLRAFSGGSGNTKILVAYASQTGASEQVAWRTANALIGRGGFVRVCALGSLSIAEIAEAGMLLVVASTYGSGDAPDMARPFLRQMAVPAALSGLRYGVLARGDREYDATFCAFGRALDQWLARSKAKRLFAPVLVDGDDDIAAMTLWAAQLKKLGATTGLDRLLPGPPQAWTLTERRLLNPGSAGGEAWHLALTPENSAHLDWTAGDIAEIWPRNPHGAVEAFLAAHDYDGDARFASPHGPAPLREILAHAHLPKLEPGAFAAATVVGQLQYFPHREYSIASLPQSGRMDLLVRTAVKENGALGLGSGWLTRHAPLGGTVPLRLRPNPNFHPPQDGPVVLIGAGTGLAGLRAHLFDRRRKGLKDAWLVFGERSARFDLFHGEEIEGFQADSTLTRLDLVFSRDATPKRYVQHHLAEESETLRQWLGRGAAILVCGGIAMAEGVHQALAAVVGENRLEEMLQNGFYRRDIY